MVLIDSSLAYDPATGNLKKAFCSRATSSTGIPRLQQYLDPRTTSETVSVPKNKGLLARISEINRKNTDFQFYIKNAAGKKHAAHTPALTTAVS
jgi:hypothetical protein